MRFVFIRHGESTGDVEDRYGGAYDDGLSGEGFAQAQVLAEELADKGIERIVTSSLLRARQTGGVVADALGVMADVETRFRERSQYGPMTGMTKAEAREKYPEMMEQVKDRLFTLPGAESYADFSRRVQEGFEDYKDSGETLAIVWHGGGMRVLFRDILKWGELKSIGDCCWVEMELDNGEWRLLDSRRIAFEFVR